MAGLFEIGICELPLLYDSFDVHPFSIETVLALPSDSPLAAHDVLTPQALDDVPFIVMGADHMVSRRTREAFHSAGARFRQRSQTDLFRNALSLVKEGLGAALIDPFTLMADDGAGYVVRRFAPRVLLDIAVVTAKDRPVSAIGRQFLDQILPAMRAVATRTGDGLETAPIGDSIGA